MKQITNKVNSINKRIEEIENHTYYVDWAYHNEKVETQISAITKKENWNRDSKNIDKIKKLNAKRAFINLRNKELSMELEMLNELRNEYAEILEMI